MVEKLTNKQTIYLLLICLIGTKFQRLPSFLSDVAGKGFWVAMLIYMIIDGFFLLLTLKIVKLGNGATLYCVIENTIGKVFAKIIFVILGVYFFALTILPYEAIHEVFSDIIFDSLPWKYFALFLLIAMGAMVISGLRNIGRICQFFFYMILIGVVGLFMLGLSTSDLTAILPISDVSGMIFDGIHKSTMWFGNFTVLYVLMGHIKERKNETYGGVKLAFFIGSLFVTAAFIVFYGIYKSGTPLKRNLLTKISQFALLSLDIGRPDWFLILFAEFATILTAAIFMYCSAYCFREVLKSKRINFISYTLLLILYVYTAFIAKEKLQIFRIIISYGAILGILVQYVFPILFIILAVIYNKRINEKGQMKPLKNIKKHKVECEA